jgi:signal transduction histidine kinase
VASVPADADRLQRHLDALRAVIEAIGSSLEFRALLTRILVLACDLIGAPYGSIGLYDEDDDTIETAATHGLPDPELGARMRPGVGLAGQVLLTRRPVVLDRYGDVPHVMWNELAEHAVVGMPIFWQERLIGFFGIGAPAGRRFDADDVETLALFARHAAVAIENARRHQTEQRRAERLALIARVGHIVTGNLTLDDMLQRAADAIHELLGYASVDIPLVESGDPEVLVIRARGGHYKAIAWEDRLPVGEGIMGAAVRERRTQLVNDVALDPRYVRPPAVDVEMRAELAVPILLGTDALGVVNVESDRRLTEEDATGLQVIADHLAVAIRNARLHERARALAVLEERQRLARDLHDSVAQLLFSVTLMAQSIAPVWQRSVAEGERQVQRLLDITRSALIEMRALLLELRPSDPETGRQRPLSDLVGLSRVRTHGLAAALRHHAAEISGESLRIDVDDVLYSPQAIDHEEALYRTAQEALSNVVEHSAARHAWLTLTSYVSHVSLTVRDDGVGFDASSAAATPASVGFGIASIRERAQALGGTLRIDTQAGLGTTLAVDLPLVTPRP